MIPGCRVLEGPMFKSAIKARNPFTRYHSTVFLRRIVVHDACHHDYHNYKEKSAYRESGNLVGHMSALYLTIRSVIRAITCIWLSQYWKHYNFR